MIKNTLDSFRKWCYNALPVVGFLAIWWECAKLSTTYLGSPYVGIFIGFWFGGWILTYNQKD